MSRTKDRIMPIKKKKKAFPAHLHKAVRTGENLLPGANRKLLWLQFLEENRKKTKC